eukprot:14565456-Ditylum_brightwellii.AAC.1
MSDINSIYFTFVSTTKLSISSDTGWFRLFGDFPMSNYLFGGDYDGRNRSPVSKTTCTVSIIIILKEGFICGEMFCLSSTNAICHGFLVQRFPWMSNRTMRVII